MYKIHSDSLLYKFLLFIPFVGIISNKLNSIFAYSVIVFFIAIMLFFKININQVTKSQVFFLALVLLNLYIVYIYQLLVYDSSSAYFIQFFGSQVFFFLLFFLFLTIDKFYTKYIHRIFEYVIYLLFFFVVIDFILLSNGMISSQLMYKPQAWSYHTKPLGLFGQFSINTTYAVVFYLLYLSFQKVISIKKNILLFLLVTFIIILEDSGTGYIVYLFLLFTIFYRSSFFRFLIIPIAIVAMFYIIQNNLIVKLSAEYLAYLYDYFIEIFKITYIDNIHNVFDFLFGINGNYNFPIDFGPMFMIAKVGFLYFFSYSLMIAYMIYKSPDRYFRMAIISLVIANIHYPALFYPIMNLILPILLVYLLNIRQERKVLYEKNIICN